MKPNEQVVSNWSTLVDDFDTSGQDLFRDIEARVQARKVPNVTVSRVEFKQSGLFSDRREYLRLQRDNLIFDVGAAPYGTGFFFSWWLVQKVPRFAWLYTVVFLVAAGVVTSMFDGGLYFRLMGLLLGLVAAFGLLALLSKGDSIIPESHIAQAPLIGSLYVRLFNPTTYHSQDIVAMYQESIRRAVNEAVDHALKAQGCAALRPEQKRLGPSDFGPRVDSSPTPEPELSRG